MAIPLKLANETAERTSLLALIEGTVDARSVLLSQLTGEHFGLTVTREIFDRLSTLVQRGGGGSLPKITSMAQDPGLSQEARTFLGVDSNAKRVQTARTLGSTDADMLIRVLEAQRKLRVAFNFGDSLQSMLSGQFVSGPSCIENILDKVDTSWSSASKEFATYSCDDEIVAFGDGDNGEALLAESFDATQREANFVSSGHPEYDARYNGFARGALMAYSAAKGSFKTSFLINTLIRQYLSGVSTMIVEMEMTKAELIDKVTTALTGIPYPIIRSGEYSASDKVKIQRVWGKFREHGAKKGIKWGIWVPSMSTRKFTPEVMGARLLCEKYGMVGIDYLTLFHKDNGMAMWEWIKEKSEYLKQLAKDIDAPILALTQLNQDGRAKYGFAIEDSVDVWMKAEVTGEDREAGFFTMEMAKNRHGSTEPFTLYVDPVTQILGTSRVYAGCGLIDMIAPPGKHYIKSTALELRRSYEKQRKETLEKERAAKSDHVADTRGAPAGNKTEDDLWSSIDSKPERSDKPVRRKVKSTEADPVVPKVTSKDAAQQAFREAMKRAKSRKSRKRGGKGK